MYGAFIRELRASRGLTQAELGSTAGVSQPNLSAYEHDRRVPTADTLNKIAVACGYELAAVAGGEIVWCPLPPAGWFPDDDNPTRLPNDPPADPSAEDLAVLMLSWGRDVVGLGGPTMHPRVVRLRRSLRER